MHHHFHVQGSAGEYDAAILRRRIRTIVVRQTFSRAEQPGEKRQQAEEHPGVERGAPPLFRESRHRTSRLWDGGRPAPQRPRRAFLTVIAREPDAVRRALLAWEEIGFKIGFN